VARRLRHFHLIIIPTSNIQVLSENFDVMQCHAVADFWHQVCANHSSMVRQATDSPLPAMHSFDAYPMETNILQRVSTLINAANRC